VYSSIYRPLRLLWPGGLEIRQHLKELKRTQWLSKDELEAFQLAKLQKIVTHAYEKVPFYRERYKQAGIHPQDIKTVQDLQALPFLTREDVQRNRENMVAENYGRQKLYHNETGGSTGQRIEFYIEEPFWWWNAANVWRGREWYGVQAGERTALFWGAEGDMPEWSLENRLRSAIMRERYLNAYSMTEEKIRSFAEMLVHWQPVMFKSYPSALCLFARYVKEWGLKGIHPRYIETTSEKLTGTQRELLEEVFGCPVGDQYSSRELGTMAYPCEQGGLHVSADLRLLEVVARGEVVPNGQMGEVAVTSLNQYAMPFIRYKNGDLATYETGNCTCRRSFPLLREIVGRTNDYLVTAQGQFVHPEFFAHTFRFRSEVVRFQVHQHDREHLEVRLVCGQPVSGSWLDNVRSEIQAHFGDGTQVSLKVVDQIELTPSGKHRYIISEVRPASI
jgi:phenylacetate-CoA ligase